MYIQILIFAKLANLYSRDPEDFGLLTYPEKVKCSNCKIEFGTQSH